MLNLSAILLIFSPIFIYVHYGGILLNANISLVIHPWVPSYLIFTGLCTCITFLISPMGFYRPHVYSDWAWNQPIQLGQKKNL